MRTLNTTGKLIVSLLLAGLLLAGLAGAGLSARAGHQSRTVTLGDMVMPLSPEIVWLGAAGDGLWSNPTNWENGRLPGPADIVRFRGDSPDARMDAAFDGVIAGLILDADYTGALTLERSLRVTGDLEMAGGTLRGGAGDLDVDGAVRVSGGLLVTPPGGALNAVTMDIAAPGVVQMSAYGKLNLSGDGQPLTGDGLLDMTTRAPNSVEYTGAATADLTDAGPAAELHAALPEEFARADILKLHTDSGVQSAVIDPVGQYAYFGTNTSPGRVVKVDLATFTRVGALTLEAGENSLLSAVIDPTGQYVYFGTGTYPGRVVRVNLATFTRAGALALAEGENSLHSAVIDPAGQYAYFGTSTSPGRVVKVNLASFTRTGALTLAEGENSLHSAVIDPAGQYAYFGTSTSPGRVVKVNLASFTRTGALTLAEGENSLHSAVIDPAGQYAYFGTSTSSGRVVKVNLTSFTRTGALTLPEGENFLSSAVIDPAGAYAYFGTNTAPGRVVRVNLITFTRTGALTLPEGENFLSSAVIDPTGANAYFSARSEGDYPSHVVKVDLASFAHAGTLTLAPRIKYLAPAVIAPAGDYAYFVATVGHPMLAPDTYAVLKIDLNTFTHVGTLTLDGILPSTAVIDPAGAYAYFVMGGMLVKIDLTTFTHIGALELVEGGGFNFGSAVIDPAGAYAYFGSVTGSPGVVVKVNLATFTRVGGWLALAQGEQRLRSAVIDPAGAYAYFGTDTSPGRVVKVNLTSFTRVGALTLPEGEDKLWSAVIDPAGAYAYFGTDTSPGRVVKVNLTSFTRAGALTLAEGENGLRSAVIDPAGAYAYFGTLIATASVVKINLDTLTYAGALTLEAGQSLYSAVIDPAGAYAYFARSGVPAGVVKIAVGAQSDLAGAKSASPDPVATGDTLIYTLSISNAGPHPAAAVRITDTLPVGVTFLEATGAGWTCDQVEGQVICTRATLPVGAAPDITLRVTAPTTFGNITNNLIVTSAVVDPNPTNNAAAVTVPVVLPRISVIIPPGGGVLVSPFDQTTYTFPAGAFTANVSVTHMVLQPVTVNLASVPAPNESLMGIGRYFDVSAVYSDTSAPASLAPGAVYTITIGYTDQQVSGVSEATLALYQYDGSMWSTDGIISEVDTNANRVTAVVNSLGVFGVFGEGERKVYLPVILHNTP